MFKRIRWKPFVALAVFILGGVATLYVVTGKMQERKEFVGTVDSKSGYRCRFTFGSNWRCKDSRPIGITGSDYLDDNRFTPSPSSPLRRWIGRHLFRETSDFVPPEIYLQTIRQKDFSWYSIFKGYPVVNRGEQVITERHFTINGCPTTFNRRLIAPGPPSICASTLLVYVPDGKIMYSLDADFFVSGDQVDHEMQAIISSFHVEKVAPPTGGKLSRTSPGEW